MRVLAIDQGTTSTKAYAWQAGACAPAGRRTHRQIRPRPGWVEHDAEEIAGHVQSLVEEAGPADAIGLANQGETVVAWDATTKRPLYNAIVWQDERTAGEVERLRAAGVEGLTLARAGLPLDPYFSATKLRWLLDHADGARALMRAGRLRLGTSDAFLLDRLSGVFATDPSTASRTSLMHLTGLAWDQELCDAFGVPADCLPEIRATGGGFGVTGRGARVVASVVDQQASLYGHGCREHGDLKITFGTGAFALGLTGDRPVTGGCGGLLPTCAWRLGGEAPVYALDGGILTAGAAVDWLRDVGLLGEHGDLDAFDGPSALARGIAFVPALSGLGSPHWNRGARGAWFGLGLGTDRADLGRAVLEGVAMRAAEVVAAFSGAIDRPGRIAVDGGLSRSRPFVTFLADALARPVHVAASADVTAIGVLELCLTVLGTGDHVSSGEHRVVHPENPLGADLHALFGRAVAATRDWAAANREGR